ncbi:dTDP-4-dehydrorhamnose 3,5-epimerase family protein [Kineococcus rhizosphaerae]|uniref:dTDP-4-dehydrorhamnose 3,5-epimerase n=1 Tax=Kineococcus rhizosphaerae TaxID=559628 RepID=A0A2T0R0V7_9ACTN|nr:dTDP-4-dehydrorhamnose 3,5-epimerase [Kineococcus rhizosphaerae]PRY12936.1 dTDP-4-dehydrorhamnose 3,5-epimerase [Kineococcus rhizosphaerae]
MQTRELAVPGAWEFTPRQFGDERGTFMEWFTAGSFSAGPGHDLTLAQANCSVSAAGVLRGVHYADVPPGQAKYVFCAAGAVLDVVVDLRVGSPTFGTWDAVVLDDVDRRAVYLSEGLGHAFLSLADGSTVVYLCSQGYAPGREHGVHPLDPALGIDWPTTGRDGRPLEFTLSGKDEQAPTLQQALEAGALPRAEDVERFVARLRVS